jgi:Ca2+-binding RTX toxin-like protein
VLFRSITGVEIIDVAANTLTLNAEQFGKLGAFELKGSGTLEVKDTANKGATIDASVVSLAFGTDAGTKLTGGTGSDTITGTIGADVMTGTGITKDTFVFSKGSGNTTTIIDEITDFTSGTDKLKLGTAGTDKNTVVADGTSFSNLAAVVSAAEVVFDGTKKFYVAYGVNNTSDGYLVIDWNGDKTADQAILLTGVNATSDFAADIIA